MSRSNEIRIDITSSFDMHLQFSAIIEKMSMPDNIHYVLRIKIRLYDE